MSYSNVLSLRKRPLYYPYGSNKSLEFHLHQRREAKKAQGKEKKRECVFLVRVKSGQRGNKEVGHDGDTGCHRGTRKSTTLNEGISLWNRQAATLIGKYLCSSRVGLTCSGGKAIPWLKGSLMFAQYGKAVSLLQLGTLGISVAGAYRILQEGVASGFKSPSMSIVFRRYPHLLGFLAHYMGFGTKLLSFVGKPNHALAEKFLLAKVLTLLVLSAFGTIMASLREKYCDSFVFWRRGCCSRNDDGPRLHGAGLMNSRAAILIGALLGSIPWYTMMVLHKKSAFYLSVDDTLGVFQTHAVAGLLGGCLFYLICILISCIVDLRMKEDDHEVDDDVHGEEAYAL
ncbi:hypothetical protein VNO78_34430 [Psophocarpus tetragonolobus]|uniref:Ammonium transporter AmtB-like domain-containing protein n=1 Tax=Psophocarpus tetragonolobus TaxID=3891 RepID=A0AAN9NUU4_PSOTE